MVRRQGARGVRLDRGAPRPAAPNAGAVHTSSPTSSPPTRPPPSLTPSPPPLSQVKRAFAVFRGGVTADVTNGEQAKIAEAAGAVAVMALERIPATSRPTAASRARGARFGPFPLTPALCLHPHRPPRPLSPSSPRPSSRPIRPEHIVDVMESCPIPVMACRASATSTRAVLEALEVDCIDESEVLTAADETHHIDKRRSTSRSRAPR